MRIICRVVFESEDDASRIEEDTWLIISFRDLGTVIWELMSTGGEDGVSPSSVVDGDDEKRLVVARLLVETES